MNNGEQVKVCVKCQQTLPLSLFGKNSGANHLRSECRKCANDMSRSRYQLRQKFQKPPENHVCPICESNKDQCKGQGNAKNGSWVLDHDHKTHEFRGWLCHKCNRALGGFNDDPEYLLKAIKYLKG
jgi:hypothetical protein